MHILFLGSNVSCDVRRNVSNHRNWYHPVLSRIGREWQGSGNGEYGGDCWDSNGRWLYQRFHTNSEIILMLIFPSERNSKHFFTNCALSKVLLLSTIPTHITKLQWTLLWYVYSMFFILCIVGHFESKMWKKYFIGNISKF